MSFDLDMETTISVVNKTIRWTIKSVSQLPEIFESSPFSPDEGDSSKWTIRLIFKNRNCIQMYLRSLDTQNSSSFVVYKVKGVIAFKSSRDEILLERTFATRIDPSSCVQCFEYFRYPLPDNCEYPNSSIFDLNDDVLVVDCLLVIYMPVTKTISTCVKIPAKSDSDELEGRNPFPPTTN